MRKWILDENGNKKYQGYVDDLTCEEIVGRPIMVYFPEEHVLDSSDGPSHFGSDASLMEFLTKNGNKFGFWKSKKMRKKLPPSKEDGENTGYLDAKKLNDSSIENGIIPEIENNGEMDGPSI